MKYLCSFLICPVKDFFITVILIYTSYRKDILQLILPYTQRESNGLKQRTITFPNKNILILITEYKTVNNTQILSKSDISIVSLPLIFRHISINEAKITEQLISYSAHCDDSPSLSKVITALISSTVPIMHCNVENTLLLLIILQNSGAEL